MEPLFSFVPGPSDRRAASAHAVNLFAVVVRQDTEPRDAPDARPLSGLWTAWRSQASEWIAGGSPAGQGVTVPGRAAG